MGEASANEGTVMLDQSSVGRLSRMDAMQQQAMASGLRAALQREKLRLEAARTRLQNGTFGVCCQCGADIVPARLRADPGAPFCAECQEAFDERR
jgi:DnaK suppressor protein